MVALLRQRNVKFRKRAPDVALRNLCVKHGVPGYSNDSVSADGGASTKHGVPATTRASIESEDADESNDTHDYDAPEVYDGVDDASDQKIVPVTVKMKLNTFCPNAGLRRKIVSVVLDANRLLGEAYAFANFHVLRVLRMVPDGSSLPPIDRNFYYRCLMAVSENHVRAATLGTDFAASIVAFDALRRGDARTKVYAVGLNQLVADLTIIMATMAKNHVWTNLVPRLKRYLSWKHPDIKRKMCNLIVNAVVSEPKQKLDKLFATTRRTAQQQPAYDTAKEVARTLRRHMCVSGCSETPRNAARTLPLYKKMLADTDRAKAAHNESAKAGGVGKKKAKKFRGRTFTLLPTKSNYTISHIPISNMLMMELLKKVGLEKFKGDGRDQDHDALWRKHFHVGLVETRQRRFANRIVTDGCAVSVLIAKCSCLVCPSPPAEETLQSMRDIMLNLRGDDEKYLRVIGIDPGVTDFVTIVDRDGNVQSYSSARYYEESKVNHSRHRIDKWNLETASIVEGIPGNDTASLGRWEAYIEAYLAKLPTLLRHRARRRYRDLRFLRFVHKQRAVADICDLIAPKDKITFVGFGNWSGLGDSPIKRRCSGPLQAVKMELRKRANVVMHSVHERNTSCTCHGCYQRLSNMRAEKTTVRRTAEGKTTTVAVGAIHKVLHCKPSESDVSCGGQPAAVRRCGTTWDRDVNAAKNILMLLELEIRGIPRPRAFLAPNAEPARGRPVVMRSFDFPRAPFGYKQRLACR